MTDAFDPREYLAERKRIHEEATEDGWQLGWTFQCWGGQNQNGDYAEPILFDGRGEDMTSGLPDGVGEAIVDAHNTLPRLVATLEKVLEEHVSYEDPFDGTGYFYCAECGKSYPCMTVVHIETILREGDNNG